MRVEGARPGLAVRRAWLVLALMSAAACGGGGGSGSGAAPVGGTAGAPACTDRGSLCADELMGDSAALPTGSQYFASEADADDALHAFEGAVSVLPVKMFVSGIEAEGRDAFPRFKVSFITVDDILLPLNRDIIFGGGPDRWNIILSPGRVWSEPGDNGMSRASFPFTLVTNQWNEAHNGVATFLYDDTRMTRIRFQVSQETALWNKLDFWGVAQATYTPGPVAGADVAAREFREELAARVRVKPWSQLAVDHGAVDEQAFTRNLNPSDVSLAAVLVDDTLYLHGAATRSGEYPYPLEMRHGVFSVTKSAGAALAMLRLAEKYGDQVFDLFITDYLDVTATHDGWNGVTFGDVLSMTTGIGDRYPDQYAAATFADENDENSSVWREVWNSFSRDRKLKNAFKYGDYPWGAGQVVRYNTAHTFILGAAMDSFYKAMEGPDADVWKMMRDEVYKPIGIRVLPTIRTSDSQPLPIWGFGYFLNAYDTARIVQLLQNDGAYNGTQILHRERTRESLYRDLNDGYPTYVDVRLESTTQQARYLHSFWSFTMIGPAGCRAHVPYMWGYGGNFVVILPNGVSAFRYADGDVHDPGALAVGVEGVRPICGAP